MLKSARLRERVAFDKIVGTPDGSGGEDRAWSQQVLCWGQVIYARGSEVIDAARLQGRAAYKIKIRSCTASRLITPDWRMRDVRRGLPSGVSGDPLAGQRYNIREVDAITDPDWIYLVVESGVAV